MRAKLFFLLYFAAFAAHSDDRLGVDTHFDQNSGGAPQYNMNNVMPVIKGFGVAYFRDALNWSLFELTPGVYAESQYKQPWIDYAASLGLKFVACLDRPPAFYGHWDITACANFAAWLAKDEAGKIAAIEVVNEPDNVAEFQGSAGLTNLVNLTTAVTNAVHAVNPNMPVIGLGEKGSNILSMLAMHPALDGLVYHPYDDGSLIPEKVYEPPYTDYETWVKAVRAATKLPIWETERNVSQGQYKGEYESAVWNARRLIMSYGLGVEHTFVYQFTDVSPTQSLFAWNLQPRQPSYVVQRLESALLNLYSIGPKVTVTAWDANFVAADFKNYCFTGPNYWSPTVAAVWFGGRVPGHYFQHTPSVVTINFPQKHPHVGGSVGGTILDLVSGKVTPIQAAQYTSTGITGVTISDNPVLIILQ
jgi:hypothetical protein